MLKAFQLKPACWVINLFAFAGFCGVDGNVFAQGPVAPNFPADASTSDINEVDDMSELDSEEGAASQQDAELSYGQSEVRSRFNYAGGLSLGTAMPWQSYGLHFYQLLNTRWAAGLYVGAGSFSDSGTIDDRSFDLELKSRSSGLEGRFFFEDFERISLQGTLSYGVWNGHIVPNSADDEESETSDKLATSFDASGVTSGFATVITWLWDDGLFIEWTPLGLRRSWILQKDQSRDTDLGDKLIRQKIERPYFYGLTNIRFGYLF